MKKITDFFVLCSGANRTLLAQCPGERTKYAGLGATIFFTGVFAFLAASYALFFVFNNAWVSLAFGLIWGLMIFNLDRFIVATMRKRGKFWREAGAALPRIAVAIVISVVIAMPLELKIFEKEINPELVLMEQKVFAEEERSVRERFNDAETKLRAEIAAIDSGISHRARLRDNLLRIAREEADGTGGSRVKNLGPIYKLKKRDADAAQQELDAFTRTAGMERGQLLARLATNDSLRNVALRSLKYLPRDGPAARMEALETLKAKSQPVATASLFVMLLILAVETAPVLVKLIAPRGPYDNLLATEEFRFSTTHLREVSEISSNARSRVPDLHKVEGTFLATALDDQLGVEPESHG